MTLFKKKTIALIGYPNSGKTTLFNQIIGGSENVGNWSGVTVNANCEKIQCENINSELTDLPGIYSLYERKKSVDINVTINFVMDRTADIILNVIDSNDLERQLFLTIQLIEMGLPVILILNKQDIATNRGISINIKSLAQTLKVPILTMVAKNKVDLAELKNTICSYEKDHQSSNKISNNLIQKIYADEIQEKIFELANTLEVHNSNKRWVALSTLEKLQYKKPSDDEFVLKQKYSDTSLQITLQKQKFIKNLLSSIVSKQKHIKKQAQNVLDKILLSKWLGIPVFLIIMFMMFTFSIVLGGSLQESFENIGEMFFVRMPEKILDWLNIHIIIKYFLIEGIGRGIVTVMTFIPIIGMLYLFLSFLEESGYMSRAAFIIESFMHKIGLPGKAFFPLLIGFGCNVPAIMASRILDNNKERIIVAMITPFMSCGARLSIYALFCAAFFPNNSAIIVFSLYMIGIIVGLITGMITKIIIKHKAHSLMILDLPRYQFPSISNILRKTNKKILDFAFGAGKLIVIVYVIFTMLNSIDTNFNFINSENQAIENKSQTSILHAAGSVIHPLFTPLGIKEENWQASVAIVTGIFAKEVVVGALYALYGIEESEPNNLMVIKQKLVKGFHNNIAVFSYLVFILLYFPCITVFSVIASEFGKKWAFFSAIWSTSIAYIMAFLIYNIANLI